MLNGKRIAVVLPAYNAGETLEMTFREIPQDIVDDIILVDDASHDNTASIAKELGIRHIIRHEQNKGYGGNQKTCYKHALELNADVIVMLHPDYQYTPKLLLPMISIISSGVYPVVLGSRILGKGALLGGMPMYKYIANRFLTFVQNILVGEKLSEYHTGYRAFSREIFDAINIENNSNDFIFDNQMLSQIIFFGFSIGEITCPTKYFAEASSINFRRSVTYGIGVLTTSVQHLLARLGIYRHVRYRR